MRHYIQKIAALVMLLTGITMTAMAGDIKILTSTYGTLTITDGATGSGTTYTATAGATVKLKLTGNVIESSHYMPEKVVGKVYYNPSGAEARRRGGSIDVNNDDFEITDIAADGTCSFTMPTGSLVVELEPFFKVNKIDVTSSNSTISGIAAGYEYTDAQQKPVPTVVFASGTGNVTLTDGTDYDVTYSNNINVGTATVTITMKGLYQGELTKTFEITKKAATITAKAQSIAYGDPIDNSTGQVTATGLIDGHTVSAVTLTASDTNGGQTGTVTPSNAKIMKGTTDVTANYNITYATGTLTVSKKSIANATVTMTPSTIACGESAPTLTVMDGQNQLVEDRDYTLQWQDSSGKSVEIASADPGTYTAVLEGKGNYTGTLVVSQKLTIDLNDEQKANEAEAGSVTEEEAKENLDKAIEEAEKLYESIKDDPDKQDIAEELKKAIEEAKKTADDDNASKLDDVAAKNELEKALDKAEAETVTEEEAGKELDDAIKEAEKLYESIKDDPDKQDIAEELKKAIEEAKKTADDDNASKLDDVAAKNDLEKALEKAEEKADEVDTEKENNAEAEAVTEEEAKENLDKAIEEAEKLYESIKDDPDKQDIAEELKKAIEEAKKTADDDNASKLDDVAAKNELEKALDKAESETVTEEEAGKELDDAIKEAEKLYESIKDDPDKQDIAEELKKAIDEAKKTAGDDNASKLDDVAAKNDLEKALEKAEEKADEVNTEKENNAEAEAVTKDEAKENLDKAIEEAEKLYESIKDDPDKQDIAEELKKAIEEAKKTADDDNASKLDDVAAKNELEKALDKAESETVTEEEAGKELDDAIKEAEKLYESIKDDPDKQDIAEELKKAIEEAKKTADDDNASKLDDVAAKNDLEKALEKAEEKADEVDTEKENNAEAEAVTKDEAKENLDKAIEEAEKLYESIKDDPDKQDIAEELKKAIEEAKKTADDDNASKLDDVAAKNELEKALDKAESETVTEEEAGKELDDAIKEAEKLYESIKDDPDKQDIAEELKKAIEEAKKTADDDNASKLDDVAAKNDLEKALEKAEEKADEVNTEKENNAEAEAVTEEEAKENLDKAIEEAEKLYESIKDDPDKQDIAEELKKAIEEAKKTADDDNASKLDDVAAKNELEKALDKAEAETVDKDTARENLRNTIVGAAAYYYDIKDESDIADIAEELKKAIDEAIKTADDENSTKLDYVTAKNMLGNALDKAIADYNNRKATAIDDKIVEESLTEGAWYDLDGRKLDRKPVLKGLYIHKGKKVILK